MPMEREAMVYKIAGAFLLGASPAHILHWSTQLPNKRYALRAINYALNPVVDRNTIGWYVQGISKGYCISIPIGMAITTDKCTSIYNKTSQKH